jgi:hypothetical protein
LEAVPKENKPEPVAPVKEDAGLEVPSTLHAEPTAYSAAGAASGGGGGAAAGEGGDGQGNPYRSAGSDNVYRKAAREEFIPIDNPDSLKEKEADGFAKQISGNTPSTKSKGPASGKIAGGQFLSENADGSLSASPKMKSRLQGTKGNGSPLPAAFKSKVEKQTGNNVDDVRVHTDSNANEMAAGLSAQAFTHEKDIFFAKNKYNPTSQEGESLLSHETAHTVLHQDGQGHASIQRMDDPDVIESRAHLKDKHIGSICTALGDGYELQLLDLLFFGKANSKVWRREIIWYYLIERGWDATVDGAPDWVHFKHVKDEHGRQHLVIWTPIEDFTGREAAFGFVRWDLGYPSGKHYYLYQGLDDRAQYDGVETFDALEVDRKDQKSLKPGTTTGYEVVFQDGYAVLDDLTAIELAHSLVTDYQENKFIINPGIAGKGDYLAHQGEEGLGNGSLSLLLETGMSISTRTEGRKEARRTKFYESTGNWEFDGEKIPDGLKEADQDKGEFIVDQTTLGTAKNIFLDGKEPYTAHELAEEGLAANNLIRYWARFKEGIGKAAFFIHAFGGGNMSTSAVKKAQSALNSYRALLVRAYRNPLDPVDFNVADGKLNDAYATLFNDVYGEDGVMAKRKDFANEAFPELRDGTTYSQLPDFVDEALAAETPKMPEVSSFDEMGAMAIDFAPMVNLDLGLGVMDIMSQTQMLWSLYTQIDEAGQSAPNIWDYYNKFLDIELKMYEILFNRQMGVLETNGVTWQASLREQIDIGRGMVQDPHYVKAINRDIGFAKISAEMEAMLLTPIMVIVVVGLTILTFWSGGVIGGIVGGWVAGGLAGTLGVTAAVLVGVTVELTVAALVATVMMETLSYALSGGQEEWGEDFGEEYMLNLLLFGIGKLFEVIVIAARLIPQGAKAMGNGVWKHVSNGKTLYYVEESVARNTTKLPRGGGGIRTGGNLPKNPTGGGTGPYTAGGGTGSNLTINSLKGGSTIGGTGGAVTNTTTTTTTATGGALVAEAVTVGKGLPAGIKVSPQEAIKIKRALDAQFFLAEYSTTLESVLIKDLGLLRSSKTGHLFIPPNSTKAIPTAVRITSKHIEFIPVDATGKIVGSIAYILRGTYEAAEIVEVQLPELDELTQIDTEALESFQYINDGEGLVIPEEMPSIKTEEIVVDHPEKVTTTVGDEDINTPHDKDVDPVMDPELENLPYDVPLNIPDGPAPLFTDTEFDIPTLDIEASAKTRKEMAEELYKKIEAMPDTIGKHQFLERYRNIEDFSRDLRIMFLYSVQLDIFSNFEQLEQFCQANGLSLTQSDFVRIRIIANNFTASDIQADNATSAGYQTEDYAGFSSDSERTAAFNERMTPLKEDWQEAMESPDATRVTSEDNRYDLNIEIGGPGAERMYAIRQQGLAELKAYQAALDNKDKESDSWLPSSYNFLKNSYVKHGHHVVPMGAGGPAIEYQTNDLVGMPIWLHISLYSNMNVHNSMNTTWQESIAEGEIAQMAEDVGLDDLRFTASFDRNFDRLMQLETELINQFGQEGADRLRAEIARIVIEGSRDLIVNETAINEAIEAARLAGESARVTELQEILEVNQMTWQQYLEYIIRDMEQWELSELRKLQIKEVKNKD